ncbi:class I SAM-dependent RNA methyltransferase [Actinocorallia sp. A-T 12471]|uniref:class I SAM-dependent RNA methyltransferase n=1 Tax=Actinocorallia sp. A-T 12471 TaxID=3089813 RepID=UPI0029CF7DD7|nr:class I SAM-dependent RNA methyltransferase [Actinocorallia sp. A-T 12471]MDX6739736.1 class I SAM-dependent RNA methyltransferase [Actinocorallia sp. A-T 12471]
MTATDLLELEVGAVGHGGFCVARHEGKVVFVRHALPGELVRARVTEETKTFVRADAVEILKPSPDRVQAPCEFAGPGRCGGCDWQHVALPAQRALKADVIAEQLHRLAGIDRPVHVEEVEVPPLYTEDGEPLAAAPGLGWRTRVQFAVDHDGGVGLRKHRSHDLEYIDRCLIAHPGVEMIGIERHMWPGASGVEGVVSAGTGDRLVVISEPKGRRGRPARVPQLDVPVRVVKPERPQRHQDRQQERQQGQRRAVVPFVREEAAGRLWQVTGSGFWQVHPAAADTLVKAVLEALEPKPGEIALDLYCGVGLFAGVLGERVGRDGLVVAVETGNQAVRDAKFNLKDLPQVSVEQGKVEDVLATLEFGAQAPAAKARAGRAQPKRGAAQGHRGGSRVRGADITVLDPPRAGAGEKVVDEIARRTNRKIAYVSCDPATLARDLKYFSARGWVLETLRAFDLFPQTSHVECVASLVRG